MGRRRPTMELISNERSRMVTYQKRKKGLMKKVEEFHILCNVDVCLIIMAPKFNYRLVEVETWPPKRDEVKRIISKYRRKGTEARARKTQDLSDYFALRKRKLEDETAKLRKANMEAKFPGWCSRLGQLSLQQIWAQESSLESKLEAAKKRISELKGKQQQGCEFSKSRGGESIIISTPLSILPPPAPSYAPFTHQKKMEKPGLDKQPITRAKPLDIRMRPAAPFDQAAVHQFLPFDINPVSNPLLMMAMNGENCTQFDVSAATNKVPFTPQSKAYLDQYDHQAVVQNLIFNNPVTCSMNYYGQSKQKMLPYKEPDCKVPDASSQKGFPLFSEFCEWPSLT